MDDESSREARFQLLLSKRGQELVRGLVEEFSILSREIAGLKRELSALADYQEARDRWLVLDDLVEKNLHLPRIVVIEPDQLLRPRDGFYPVEYTSSGVPFRWTGPSVQFSFDLYIDRRHGADLRLEVLNSVDFSAQKNLTLLVDSTIVPLKITQEGNGFNASAVLPRSTEGRSTSIVFVLPAVIVPPESNETRSLGVAFGRLTVAARNADGAAPETKPRPSRTAQPAPDAAPETPETDAS
jgi:hypothetical protein